MHVKFFTSENRFIELCQPCVSMATLSFYDFAVDQIIWMSDKAQIFETSKLEKKKKTHMLTSDLIWPSYQKTAKIY